MSKRIDQTELSPLPRVIGLIGVALVTVVAIGLTDIRWFIAILLAIIASLVVIVCTRSAARSRQ